MQQTAAAMPFPGLLVTPLEDAGRDFSSTHPEDQSQQNEVCI